MLLPQATLVKASFGHGVLPLWNWYEWAGSPLLAAMQSAPLYPPMWVTLIVPLPYGLQLYTFVHLVWAACGAAWLAHRQFALKGPSVVFAAVAYAGNGFFLGHIEQANSIAAMSWAPWIFGLALDYVNNRARITRFIAAVSMAFLAGHPQQVVLALLFLEGYLIVEGCAQRKYRFGRFLAIQAAIAFAAVIASAQFLPALELAALSERVWPYPDPYNPALEWPFLKALFIPRYYNHLADTSGQPIAYSELGLYGGMLTFVFFTLGFVLCARRSWRTFLPLALTGLLALLYALGSHGLIAPLVLRFSSFLQHSRGAARSLNIFVLMYALIAAHGMPVGFPGTSKLAEKTTRLVPWLFVLLLFGDLTLTHMAESRTLIFASESLSLLPGRISGFIRLAQGEGRLYRFMMSDSDYYLDHRPEAVIARATRLQPDMSILGGVQTLDGYEEGLLPTRSFANFLRKFNRNLRNETVDAPLLGLMGSNLMLTEYSIAGLRGTWTPTNSWNLFNVQYSLVSSAYRHAWFLDQATMETGIGIASTTKTLDLSASYSGNAPPPGASQEATKPWREPMQTQISPHPFERVTTETFAQAATGANMTLASMEPNKLTFNRNISATQRLLFLAPPYPGWKVRISVPNKPDRVAELQPRGAIFSELSLPSTDAASSTITICFEPFSFRLGLFMSLIGLAAFAVFASTTRRQPIP